MKHSRPVLGAPISRFRDRRGNRPGTVGKAGESVAGEGEGEVAGVAEAGGKGETNSCSCKGGAFRVAETD